MITDILKPLTALNKLYIPHDMPSFFLSRGIITAKGKRNQICAGDKISLNMWGQLVDVTDKPSHEILRCIGSLYPPYKIEVRNLGTDLITQIEI